MRISRLIKFGHSWSEIQNYSFAQIKLFSSAAIEIEAEDRRNYVLETAIAAQGDSKAIQKAVKQLGG